MTENPPTETAEEAVRLNDTCLRALRVEDSKQALPGQLFLQVTTSQDELDTPSLHTPHTSGSGLAIVRSSLPSRWHPCP